MPKTYGDKKMTARRRIQASIGILLTVLTMAGCAGPRLAKPNPAKGALPYALSGGDASRVVSYTQQPGENGYVTFFQKSF